MKKEPTGNFTGCISENNILVLAPNWLGDAVMSLPFFTVLRKRHPQSFITAACREYVYEVFRRCSDIDRLLVTGESGIFGKASEIRASCPEGVGYRICFILRPSFSSALTAFLAGISERIGYGTDFRKLLLTRSLKGASYRIGHLTESYIRLLELEDGVSEDGIPVPALEPPGQWRSMVRSMSLPDSYIVFSPGATYGPAKLWPANNYRKLAEELCSDSETGIVAVGSSVEEEYISGILGNIENGVNLAGKTGMRELMAVLKGARAVIGNDSGTVHLSAALGTPTVAIFGSTSPEWTSPRGEKVEVLDSDLPCSPCFERECRVYEYARCFDDINIEDVVKAYSRMRKGADIEQI